MTINADDFGQAFRALGIPHGAPVIAHVSLSAFGPVDGGPDAVVSALLAEFPRLIMPAFTFQTELIPEAGPACNGITYGSGRALNRMADFYTSNMPVDRIIGRVAETLRSHAKSNRSNHPILSFTGVGPEEILAAQTIAEPLAPIGKLVERDGWVLLMGVNHTSNTSIHYVERRMGRKQFVRWALTLEGVVECPNYPGCSDGFEAIAPYVEMVTRRTRLGDGRIDAIPLKDLYERVSAYLAQDPLGLLCARPDCERCNAVRGTREQKPRRSRANSEAFAILYPAPRIYIVGRLRSAL